MGYHASISRFSSQAGCPFPYTVRSQSHVKTTCSFTVRKQTSHQHVQSGGHQYMYANVNEVGAHSGVEQAVGQLRAAVQPPSTASRNVPPVHNRLLWALQCGYLWRFIE